MNLRQIRPSAFTSRSERGLCSRQWIRPDAGRNVQFALPSMIVTVYSAILGDDPRRHVVGSVKKILLGDHDKDGRGVNRAERELTFRKFTPAPTTPT